MHPERLKDARTDQIERLLAPQTPATARRRRIFLHTTFWLAWPATLVECMLMACASLLNYVFWRAAFLGPWHSEKARQPPQRLVKQKIDVENALGAMQSLEDIARGSGGGLFWISGTLLGLERLGRPLPHDTDMDAGIRADDPRLAQFIRAMWQSPDVADMWPQFLPLKTRIQNPDLHMLPRGLIRYQSLLRNHAAPGREPVKTDIFIHYDYCGGSMHGSRNTLWWNTPFAIVRRPYGDRQFSVPSDTHLHLTENYGDYRTEVKDFENCIDCPNAMDVFSWKSLAYLLLRQYAMLKRGRIDRAGQINRRIRSTILKGAWPLCVRAGVTAGRSSSGRRAAAWKR